MLTLVLPVRGREEHTRRLIKHWSETSPRVMGGDQRTWPLIVVDGGNGSLRTEVERAGATYIHQPNQGMRHWMETNLATKIGLDAVRTPYAAWVHNDDFVLPYGTQHCLGQLEAHPSYIAWGGCVMAFDIDTSAFPPVYGRLARLKLNFNHLCWAQDFDHDSAWERASAGMNNQAIQFAVYRTDALREVMTRSCSPHFSDGFVHEYFVHTFPLSLGKIKMDGTIASYLKQQRASLRFEDPQDWCLHLVRSADYRADCDRLKATLGPKWQEGSAKLASWLVGALRSEYRFGKRLTAAKFRLLLERPRAAMWLLRMLYLIQNQHELIFTDLERQGATASYRDILRGEMKVIERILEGPQPVHRDPFSPGYD